jgi:hypothetical protein
MDTAMSIISTSSSPINSPPDVKDYPRVEANSIGIRC